MNGIPTTLLIVFILLSVVFIYFTVCFYFILKKEKIPAWHAFIPLLNAYHYLNICKLPIWTMFVPFINIFLFIFSPFRLAKQYMIKRKVCYLAIPFPYIFFAYIAFSKARNIDKIYSNTYINSTKDIDLLEKRLIETNSTEASNEKRNEETPKFKDTKDDILYSSEDVALDDAPSFDELVYENPNENQITEGISEITEQAIDDLSIESIEDLEKNIIESSSVEKNIITDIKEYKTQGPSNEAIAFGGEKQIENIAATQTKNDELKCPRCGSSLVGADNSCPGCGMNLKNT